MSDGKIAHWQSRGSLVENDDDRIQFLSSLEYIEKIDYSSIRTIADIGSGPGHQAFVFSTKGLNVTCVDHLKPIYELSWLKPDEAAEQKFDAVWSHHCLEHIPNPIEALITWRMMLNERGKLFLTVPEIGLNMSSGHIKTPT